MDREQFQKLLESKRDWIIVHLSATWCAPCKVANPIICRMVEKLPDKVTYLDLDVDSCFDVYAVLKSKKQVKGVPSLLGYKPGNATMFADVSCSGSNEEDIVAFFSKLC
jgi:thiol-disulfide isomerase/thioredoxin